MSKETTINGTGTGTGDLPTTVSDVTVVASVTFGNPMDGSGPCVGRGICKQHARGPATKVTNSLTEDRNVLVMSFSMSELKQIQPEQAEYFASGSYPFGSDYLLDDPMYKEIGILPGGVITVDSPNNVVINGDSVRYSVVYQHD